MTQEGSTIRVLLVDDHPAVRLGVRRLVEDQPDMLVVGEASGAVEALGKLELRPNVLVLDYQLGAGQSGLWVARRIAGLQRAPAVLIYSAFADEALAIAAIVAGADGLLDKQSLGEELCNVIRALAHGHHSLPVITRSVAQAMGSQLEGAEEAIFGMLLYGVEPREIMARMGMSAEELASRRLRILRAIAPRIGHSSALSNAHVPLDYEPIRTRLNRAEESQPALGRS